jgi:hypothetical protein
MELYSDYVPAPETHSNNPVGRFKRHCVPAPETGYVPAPETQKCLQIIVKDKEASNRRVIEKRGVDRRRLKVGLRGEEKAPDIEKKKLPAFSAEERGAEASVPVDPTRQELRAELRAYFERMLANGKSCAFCLEVLRRPRWRERYEEEDIVAVSKEFEAEASVPVDPAPVTGGSTKCETEQ